MAAKKTVSYQDAGVNIAEADRAVKSIREMARKTFSRAVLTDIGSFGGGFLLKGWKNPVLVSSADGVGTKLKIAFLTGRHETIGEDLVNHCVNDIAVQGAVPLFFLDYFAAGKLDASVVASVVEGIARGCANNRCALIGGETAEMPGMYADGEYDLAGFIVGAVERKKMITGKEIRAGDAVIGLAAAGLHTNGYSLARKLLFETAGRKADDLMDGAEITIADELLKVHRSYLKPLHKLHRAGILKGAAHITGGGLTDNTPRILPKGLGVRIDSSAWTPPPIFELLRKTGNLTDEEYRRAFNLGIGMAMVVDDKDQAKARKILDRLDEPHYAIGRVVRAARGARVVYQ